MATGRDKGTLTREIQGLLRDLIGGLQQLNDAVGAKVELRPGDLVILDLLARYGPMSPGEIARSMGIHPATLTGIVDRLESEGWLERTPDPDDRRRTRLVARRDRGPDLIRLYAPMNRSLSEICAALTPNQLALIRDFLRDAAAAGASATQELRTAD
jgi:DNA-binding MarR family transcriptional regulator